MNWYQHNVRNQSRLGEIVARWLVQGINGLDASAFTTMTTDLRSVMDSPLDDYSAMVNEGAVIAEQIQRQPLSWQQQELLQRITTLNNGTEPTEVFENTGGIGDGTN
jgi:hypothetical protein